jgi:hypothetical protein
MTYRRKFHAILAVLVFALLFAPPARAAEGQQTSTLTLNCHYEDHKMVDDVYNLYLVAELDGSGSYTAVEPYDAEDVEDLFAPDTTATQRRTKARALETFVRQNDITENNSITIGDDGTGMTEGLTLGIYLCVRDEASPSQQDYLMDPFLFESMGHDLHSVIGTTKYTPRPDDDDPPPDDDDDDDDDDTYIRRPYYTGQARAPGDYTGGTPGAPLTQFPQATAPLTQFPPGTAPTGQKPLPPTGQLKWPIPLLIVAGVAALLTGFELRYGGRKPDDKD